MNPEPDSPILQMQMQRLSKGLDLLKSQSEIKEGQSVCSFRMPKRDVEATSLKAGGQGWPGHQESDTPGLRKHT